MTTSDFLKITQYISGKAQLNSWCFLVPKPMMHPRTGQSNQQKIETGVVQKTTQAASQALWPKSPSIILLFLFSFKINMFLLQSHALQDLSPRQGRPPPACSADSYQTTIMFNVECKNKNQKTNPNQPTNQTKNPLIMVPTIWKFSTDLGRKAKNIWSGLGYKDCQRAGHDAIKQKRPGFWMLPLLFASDDHCT